MKNPTNAASMQKVSPISIQAPALGSDTDNKTANDYLATMTTLDGHPVPMCPPAVTSQ